MASIRKRDPNDPNSPWVVEYTDAGGKRRRETPKSGLKRDAEKIKRRIEGELDVGAHVAKNASAKMSDLCDDYLRLQDQRRRDGMIGAEWRTMLERTVRLHILPYLGNKTVSELHLRDVEKWWTDLAANSRSSLRTRLTYLETAKQIEKLGKRREYTRKAVFAEFKPERAVSRNVIDTFTVDDIKRIIEALKKKPRWLRSRMWATMKCAVYLSAFCGLRRGEIFGLKAENVDFDARLIRVRNSLTAALELKGPKTRSGVRDVPMPAPVEAVLREWVQDFYGATEEGLFLTTEKGQACTMSNGFYHAWGLLLTAAGLQQKGEARPFHFHALRHFAASWMLEGKLSPPDVASILGHRTFDMTLQVYAHSVFSGQHRHDALDRMASALVKSPLTVTLPAFPTRQGEVTDATKTRLVDLSH